MYELDEEGLSCEDDGFETQLLIFPPLQEEPTPTPWEGPVQGVLRAGSNSLNTHLSC